MPTKHPRHTITETGRVAEVLQLLRGQCKVDLAELVILGGEEKLRRIEDEREAAERRAELRARLVERSRPGVGIDADAAFEVRDGGWVHG